MTVSAPAGSTGNTSAANRLLVLLSFAALGGLAFFGVLRPLDVWLQDLRFGASSLPPTATTVFVDIDSRSLSQIGVWPWPRSIHAKLLDRLMESGAEEVVFDVDFSAASIPTEDRALAESLANAGGYAYLAAFQQSRAASSSSDLNLPLPMFRDHAAPVAVNVSVDAAGIPRRYPYALQIGPEIIPSAASLLAKVDGSESGEFGIDFSIDAAAIDRIPVIDVLDGVVDHARIFGKQVIIGASAVELRDLFAVPGQSILPGALVQILAAETLKQNRATRQLPIWPAAVILVGMAILALGGRGRNTAGAISLAVLTSLLCEVAALLAQRYASILVDTAIIHCGAIALILAALAAEIVARGEHHRKAARERDAIRKILDRVVADNFDGVIVVNSASRIIAASQAGEGLIGRPLLDQAIAEVLPPNLISPIQDCLTSSAGELSAPREMRHVNEAGERLLEFVVRRSSVVLEDGMSAVACLTVRDITERRAAEEHLRYLSRHDPLTGALSRTRLVEAIEAKNADSFAVVLVDLRRFRLINDTLGHSQGDELLKQVVSRLRSLGPDLVARLGGDSFAVLIPGSDPARTEGYCQAVVRCLAFPYELTGGHQAVIAASAGATTSSLSGYEAETLLSHADMALSSAKQVPGNGTALFEPAMDNRLRDRQVMHAALRQALVEQQFTLAYQPQIDIRTGVSVGAEALARWTHPKLGSIPPSRFVPAAEETGLIVELGRWALEAACREAAMWGQHLTIAVNVSALQFELSDVAADVRRALTLSGLAPDRLEVEITESMFAADINRVAAHLQEIRGLGVRIALDDFGTGYSSLSYLGSLPIDKIKIDQSFVKRLPADPQAAAIAQAVVAISQALGKSLIAEGVEDADQAQMLNLLGCHHAQGFLYGRPMTASEFRTRHLRVCAA